MPCYSYGALSIVKLLVFLYYWPEQSNKETPGDRAVANALSRHGRPEKREAPAAHSAGSRGRGEGPSRTEEARGADPRGGSRAPGQATLRSEQAKRESQTPGAPALGESSARSPTKLAALRELEEKGVCNRDGLIKAQRADKHIKKLYDFMSNDTAAFTKRELKILKGKTKFLRLTDDVVYRIFKNGRRIYLPLDLRAAALSNAHEPPFSGHFGINRTLHKIQRHFYWPRLSKDVCKYVRSCEPCQRYKPLKTKQVGYLQMTEHVKPFQTLYCDFEGPLVRTPRGNKYLLVFTCGHTKYCEIRTVKDSTALVFARAMVSMIYARHGSPIRIISDSGPAFKSKVWEEICKLLKVTPRFCTPFWPQANACERVNQTLLKLLSIYSKNHSNWDVDLDLLQFAVNNAVNDTTGVTPFEMLYGRPAREVTDPIVDPVNDGSPTQGSEYVERLKERLKEVHEFAATRTGIKQRTYKEHYDSSRAPSDFKSGDLVLVLTHPISNAAAKFTAKLAPKFYGPFKIVQQYSDSTFKLKCVRTGKFLTKRHAAQLKHYHGRDEDPGLSAGEAGETDVCEREPGLDVVSTTDQPVETKSRVKGSPKQPVSLVSRAQRPEPPHCNGKASPVLR